MKRRPRTARQDRAIAYHEAGHAVLALQFNVPARVTIERVRDLQGGVTITIDDAPDVSRCLSYATICLAGGIAERRAIGRRSRTFCDAGDHKLALGHIRDMVVRTRRSMGASLPQGLLHLQPVAKWLVVRHWPQIEAVAHALLERRTLSASEIARVMDQAERGLKPRKRRGRHA